MPNRTEKPIRPSTLRLQPVGWWSWDIIRGARMYLKRPLHHDVSNIYSDFGGRELVVTVIDYWPYFKVVKDPGGSLQPHSGIDYNILTVLGNKLNFT